MARTTKGITISRKAPEDVYPHIKTIKYLTKEINDRNKRTVGQTKFVDPIHIELLELAKALTTYTK